MNKILLISTILILGFLNLTFAQDMNQTTGEKPKSPVMLPGDLGSKQAPVEGNEFIVFISKTSKSNHFVPSGWMGDFNDIKMNDNYKEKCHSNEGCVQFIYDAKKSMGQGWAGVYWQNPANNWGKQRGGYNLTGMTKLTFWARGEKGNEKIDKFIIGGITGQYPDSLQAELPSIDLTKEWKQYTIDLTGKDLSYVNGGFGWAVNATANPDGCTFYLSEIKYQK